MLTVGNVYMTATRQGFSWHESGRTITVELKEESYLVCADSCPSVDINHHDYRFVVDGRLTGWISLLKDPARVSRFLREVP